MQKNKMPVPTEAQEQMTLFSWAAMQSGKYPELNLLYHVPNGGSRHKAEAGRLRAEGVKAGVPDLCLPVARGQYHGLYIELTGLSDVRNAIYSTNSMGQDGDTYLGYRIESRDIDIVGYIKERDKQAAQNLRRKLNRILNPQYEATLTYVFGDFRRVIGCKIDDAPIFKRKPIFEQFTVSLSCLNPFWREETETREDIATWIGGFEFPVPDGLELYDGWEIGYRQPSLIVNVYNSGDVKSGIRIEFRAIGAVTNPVLLNVDTREFIKLNISLVAGDVLTVSTGYGEKAVKLNRGGTITDAFRYLDVDSSYLQIAVGDNLFRYSADANAENLEVSIYHNNLYLGV